MDNKKFEFHDFYYLSQNICQPHLMCTNRTSFTKNLVKKLTVAPKYNEKKNNSKIFRQIVDAYKNCIFCLTLQRSADGFRQFTLERINTIDTKKSHNLKTEDATKNKIIIQRKKNQQETSKFHSFIQKIKVSQTVVDEKNHIKVRLSHTLNTNKYYDWQNTITSRC